MKNDSIIRRQAKKDNLIAKKSRKDGLWYFADMNNCLQSPEQGLTEDEALKYVFQNEGKFQTFQFRNLDGMPTYIPTGWVKNEQQ